MSARPVVYGRISGSHPRNMATVEQQQRALLEYVRSRWPEEHLLHRMTDHQVGPLDRAAEQFRTARGTLHSCAGRRS